MCMQIQLNFNINKSRVLPQNCTCYNASAECLYYYSVTWICNHIAQCVENAFNASHATNKQYFTNPQEATISIRRKNVTNIKSHSFFFEIWLRSFNSLYDEKAVAHKAHARKPIRTSMQ